MSVSDEKTIKGIKYKDIQRFDRVEKGKYNITKFDGETSIVDLERKESFSVQTYLRHRDTGANPTDTALVDNADRTKISDIIRSGISEKQAIKMSYDWRSVEFKEDDLVGYWPTDETLSGFLGTGLWILAKPEYLKNPEYVMGAVLPGSGIQAGHLVNRDGHTLICTTKENRELYQRIVQNKGNLEISHENVDSKKEIHSIPLT